MAAGRRTVVDMDEAEARYRAMAGMDLPLSVRASIARENASKIEPLVEKTW